MSRRFFLYSLILAALLTGCSFLVTQESDHSWRVDVLWPTSDVTLTPIATFTPMPTSTPTVAPTVTPTPTVAPTITPTPTLIPPTPTPETAKCWGRVADGPLRVRATPSLNGAILGAIPKGDTLTLEATAYDAQNNLWYRIWWTPTLEGYVAGWLITLGEWADCSLIPGPRLGLHLTMTVNGGSLSPIFPRLGTLKATSLNGHLLAAAKAVNPQIVTIYRSTRSPDCPPDEMNASQWLDQVSRDWPPDADYYEFVNECILPTSRWISLSIQAMQWAERRGLCLLLFSFAVGQPEISQWQQLTPVLDYSLTHPCRSGRRHGIALHSYDEGYPLTDPWVFSRPLLLCNSIARQYCDQLPLYLTEVGLSDMATGAVDCGRWLFFAHEVGRLLAGTVVDGYHVWSVGTGTGWVDAGACLGDLLR